MGKWYNIFNVMRVRIPWMCYQQMHPPAASPAADAPPADAPPADAPPADAPPDWCKCGFCRSMPTQVENKCCCGRKMPCITTKTLFRQLVLDANILHLQMRYREDILVMNNPRSHENFRHSAYRQYVLWQHGPVA